MNPQICVTLCIDTIKKNHTKIKMQPMITDYLKPIRESGIAIPTKCINQACIKRAEDALKNYAKSPTTNPMLLPLKTDNPPDLKVPKAEEVERITKLLKVLETVKVDVSMIITNSNRTRTSNEHYEKAAEDPALEIDMLLGEAKNFTNFILEMIIGKKEGTEDDTSSELVIFIHRLFHSFSKYMNKNPGLPKTDSGKHRKKRFLISELSKTAAKNIVRLKNEEKLTMEQIGVIYGCSRYSISRVIKEYNESDNLCGVEIGKAPKTLLNNINLLECIEKYISKHNGVVSIFDIKRHLETECYTTFSTTAIYNALKHKLTYCRRRCGKPIPDINDLQTKKNRFSVMREYLILLGMGYKPVCLDECGFETSNCIKYIWAKRGVVCPRIKLRARQRINMIAAITYDSIISLEFHIGSTNQITFLLFLDALLRHIKSKEEAGARKHFLFMDNGAFHRTPYIFSLISTYKIPCLFNAPNCCFTNSIELFFNYCKIKLSTDPTTTAYAISNFSNHTKI